MRKFFRTECPAILAENWQKWGEKYANNRKQNLGFTFQWPQVEGQKLNQLLLPSLRKMTQDHCSYCDRFPMYSNDNTIDHFQPKSNAEFYKKVCQWENLYLACSRCQKAKMEQFHEQLLRPDDSSYDFLDFFIYNYTNHTIEPNPLASVENQQRATVTIEIFQLNEPGLVIDRRHSYERFHSYPPDYVLDDFAFRFMLV